MDLRGHTTAEKKHNGLKHGTAREHGLQVLLPNDALAEDEFPQAREDNTVEYAGCVREPPAGEVEAFQGAAPEEGAGEHVEAGPRDVGEGELVHALGGERADPAREDVPLVTREVAGQVDGEEGARVAVDGVRDGGCDGAHASEIAAEEEVGVVEDERGGREEAAPLGGEQGGARSVLGGEEGDDGGEDVVGQAADEVLVATSGAGCGAAGARVAVAS